MIVAAGTVVLNNSSSGSAHAIGGNTTVSGGTLQLSGTGGDQIFNGAGITVSSGAFDLNGMTETMNTLSLTGTGLSSAGALINSSLGTTSSVTVTTGISLPGNASIGGSGGIVFASEITNAGRLTYVGSGTLTLNGTNTYTGGTVVNSGTLEIGATGSVAGNVTNTSATAVLQLDNASAMAAIATLTLTNSQTGAVNLNFSGKFADSECSSLRDKHRRARHLGRDRSRGCPAQGCR